MKAVWLMIVANEKGKVFLKNIHNCDTINFIVGTAIARDVDVQNNRWYTL